MKKLLSLGIIFLLLASTFSTFIPPIEAQNSSSEVVIFFDDFESYQVGSFPTEGGWQLVKDGMGKEHQKIVDTISVSGTKSLQLRGEASIGGNALIQRPFISSSPIIGYEIYVYIDEIKKYSWPSVGFGDSAEVSFRDDGKIYALYVEWPYVTSKEIGTYSSKSWYKIKVVLNRDKKTYDVWVNDILKATNLVPLGDGYSASLTLSTGVSDVRVYFDDVKVFALPKEKLDVKFKGEVTDIVEAIDFAGTPLAGIYYIITVKVSDVLEDPTGSLKAGMIAHVTFSKDFPNVEEVKVGDLVEVYGAFKGIEDNTAKICLEKPEHYLRNLFLVKIKGLTLIAQETPNSCWAASSEMVIKYYGTYASTISQIQIAREVGNENYYWDGMPMSEVLPIIGDIEQALERLGKLDFDREILPPGLTFDEVMNDINLGRPIIAFTKVGENWLHWVVIGGYIDRPGTLNDEVIIYNPAPVNVGSIEIIPWSNFKKSLWSFPGLEAARTKPKIEKIGISAHVDEARHHGSLGFIVKSNAWTPWYASIEKWNAGTKEWNIIDRKVGRGTLTFNVDVGLHGPGNYRLWTRLLLAAEGSVNWEVTITPEPVKEATPKSEITLILQEPLHKLYLHVYDIENRHIGVNYEANQVENEIPGANYVELNNVTVVILPPEITNFKYIVDATRSIYDEEKYNLTILTIEKNVLKSQKLYEATIKREEKQTYDVKISHSLQTIDIEKIEETPLYLRVPILFFIVFGTGILSSGILIFLLKKRLNKVKIRT